MLQHISTVTIFNEAVTLFPPLASNPHARPHTYTSTNSVCQHSVSKESEPKSARSAEWACARLPVFPLLSANTNILLDREQSERYVMISQVKTTAGPARTCLGCLRPLKDPPPCTRFHSSKQEPQSRLSLPAKEQPNQQMVGTFHF